MIVGAGLPSVSVHMMVMDIPTRVVTLVAGLMVREGCTGGGRGREGRQRGEGGGGREGREGREREGGKAERGGREGR